LAERQGAAGGIDWPGAAARRTQFLAPGRGGVPADHPPGRRVRRRMDRAGDAWHAPPHRAGDARVGEAAPGAAAGAAGRPRHVSWQPGRVACGEGDGQPRPSAVHLLHRARAGRPPPVWVLCGRRRAALRALPDRRARRCRVLPRGRRIHVPPPGRPAAQGSGPGRPACGEPVKLARVLPAALAAALVAGPAPALGQAPSRRILVMPFDAGREPSIVWLGEAASVLLADDLIAYGVAAIPRAERQEAFEQLQVPPVTTLTDATVIRIGQLLGAAEVVTGSV